MARPSITIESYGGGFFDAWIDLEGVDESATLDAFYAALEAKIRERFGGEYEIEHFLHRGAGPDAIHVYDADGYPSHDEDDVAATIEDLGHQLMAHASDWTVMLVESSNV